MAYPQAAATQSLSKQSHDNICLIIHPPPQPIKTQLATAARLINILKTPTAPQSLSNMHLNHCILQISFKDWLQAPTRSIITPQICRLLLHKFRRHVGHVLVAVEEPNLPQLILPHSNYKSPIMHQRTPLFHC